MRILTIFFILISLVAHSQKGKTFYVQGSQLHDPCGNPIRLIGVNKLSVFRLIQEEEAKYFEEIALTGANCVRIAWGIRKNETTYTTANELEILIKKCIDQKMIPIITLFDYTDFPDGGFDRLTEYTDFWVRSDIRDLMKKYEAWVILNIANEASKEGYDSDTFLNSNALNYVLEYSKSIQRIRSAGITVPIMIDGLDRGKSIKGFYYKINQGKSVAQRLLDSDTQQNLIFASHAYWPKTATDGTNIIEDVIQNVKTAGFCFVVGEVSKFGAYAGTEINEQGQVVNRSVCSQQGLTDYLKFVTLSNLHNFGWLTWEWGPGNNGAGDILCSDMDMTHDSKFTGLRGWGIDIVKNPIYGITSNSKKTAYFDKDCLCEGVTLKINSAVNSPSSTPNVGGVLQTTFNWHSSSSNIQSYVLEIKESPIMNRNPVNRSIKIPYKRSNPNPALRPIYQNYNIGSYRNSAQLKVFRKNGSECYVTPRL